MKPEYLFFIVPISIFVSVTAAYVLTKADNYHEDPLVNMFIAGFFSLIGSALLLGILFGCFTEVKYTPIGKVIELGQCVSYRDRSSCRVRLDNGQVIDSGPHVVGDIIYSRDRVWSGE